MNEELGEKYEDFEGLHRSMIEQYQPVGRVEHLLVEWIAACWFRLGRVIRAETGELTKGVINRTDEWAKDELTGVERVRQILELAEERLGFEPVLEQDDQTGIGLLKSLLREGRG